MRRSRVDDSVHQQRKGGVRPCWHIFSPTFPGIFQQTLDGKHPIFEGCLKQIQGNNGYNCWKQHERPVSDHHVQTFKQCGDGLHFLDTSTLGNSVFSSNSAVNGYSYLQTVTSNKQYFTCCEIEGANAARNLQQLLWWPSDKTYHKAVVSPYLRNCTITPDDITRAKTIHGPVLPPIKGNMVDTRPTMYTPIPRVDIPAPIIAEHRDLSLQMDLC